MRRRWKTNVYSDFMPDGKSATRRQWSKMRGRAWCSSSTMVPYPQIFDLSRWHMCLCCPTLCCTEEAPIVVSEKRHIKFPGICREREQATRQPTMHSISRRSLKVVTWEVKKVSWRTQHIVYVILAAGVESTTQPRSGLVILMSEAA